MDLSYTNSKLEAVNARIERLISTLTRIEDKMGSTDFERLQDLLELNILLKLYENKLISKSDLTDSMVYETIVGNSGKSSRY